MASDDNNTDSISRRGGRRTQRESRGHVQSQRSTHSAGSEMGAVVSVFDAMSRKCPSQGPVLNEWPTNVHAQQHMVVATRNVFGMDWRYGIEQYNGEIEARLSK